MRQRGVMFRQGFEKYIGIHHLETKWENIPGREKKKKDEQRHRGMKIVDLFSLKHKV